MLEGIMADLAWFLALFIVFCSSPDILRHPILLARERETFSVHVCLMVLELARLKIRRRRRKKMPIFNFSNLASIRLI